MEENEEKKIKEVIELVEDNISTNEKIYEKRSQLTDDEYLLYTLSREYETKNKNLHRALKNPYFARIDFKADDENKCEKIYIGKTNIFDDDLNIVVVDWRAPISSIYYDGTIGRTQYKCPEGTIKGDLRLKRQYNIKNGKLVNYNDIDITTNDQLLQDCLNEKSDVRLKNIISTIQSEQNKIIRANIYKPLIVQGVAGSGKTTVALHRIAYLIYTYEKDFKPDDFLIIAPNKFFLDYISKVLPDLGVDYVGQQTFEEFALNNISDKIKVINPNVELAKIVDEGKEHTKLLQESAKFKSSLAFKNLLDKYLNTIYENILINEDFKIAEFVAIKYEDLKKILYDNLERFSLKTSVDILKNIMIKKIHDLSDSLVEKITEKRTIKINNIGDNLNPAEKQKIRLEIFNETEYEINELLKGGKKLVNDYIKKIKIDKVINYYKNALINEKDSYYSDEIAEYIKEQLNNNLKYKQVEYEDLAGILYLQYKIYGFDEKFSLKHIVIDEAQDYGEFQFFVLNYVLGNNKSLTILGDIAQGIYSYRGTSNWEHINKVIFNNEASIENLDRSYRTTVEIMNEANKVLAKINEKENLNLAVPVERHGDDVHFIHTNSVNEKVKIIENRIKDLMNKNYKNIAIITKDLNGSKELYNKLNKTEHNVQLIEEQIDKYYGGITIIPSYLSKGLEFDNVIIYDYNNFDDSVLDTKLLYVSFTRAMHTLDVLI